MKAIEKKMEAKREKIKRKKILNFFCLVTFKPTPTLHTTHENLSKKNNNTQHTEI